VTLIARRKPVHRRAFIRLVRYDDLQLGYSLDLALRMRWRVFLLQLRRCRKRCSEPAVHDLRVATRRLIAVLDLLQAIAPSVCAEKTHRQFKRVLKTMGPLRDTQIQLLRVKEMLPKFSSLELFHTVLMLRERRVLKQIAQRLMKVNEPRLRTNLAQCLFHMRRLFRNAHVRSAVETALEGALAAAYARVASIRNQLGRRDPAAVHKLRVAFKRFRYISEILQPGVERDVRKAMNAYQTTMGDLHDVEVLMENVKTFASQQPQPAVLMHVQEELDRQLTQKMTEFMKMASKFHSFYSMDTGTCRNNAA
jgi:CHAD domain-containing protein